MKKKLNFVGIKKVKYLLVALFLITGFATKTFAAPNYLKTSEQLRSFFGIPATYPASTILGQIITALDQNKVAMQQEVASLNQKIKIISPNGGGEWYKTKYIPVELITNGIPNYTPISFSLFNSSNVEFPLRVENYYTSFVSRFLIPATVPNGNYVLGVKGTLINGENFSDRSDAQFIITDYPVAVGQPEFKLLSKSITLVDNGNLPPRSAVARFDFSVTAKNGRIFLNGDNEASEERRFARPRFFGTGAHHGVVSASSTVHDLTGQYTIVNSGMDNEYYVVEEGDTVKITVSSFIDKKVCSNTSYSVIQAYISGVYYGISSLSDITRSELIMGRDIDNRDLGEGSVLGAITLFNPCTTSQNIGEKQTQIASIQESLRQLIEELSKKLGN